MFPRSRRRVLSPNGAVMQRSLFYRQGVGLDGTCVTVRRRGRRFDKKKAVLFSFFHGVYHNLEGVGLNFDAPLMFHNDCKLFRLPPFEETKTGPYPAKYSEKIIDCRKGVVCEIPLACGFRSIGPTGRCINTRFTQHKRYIKTKSEYSEIFKHLLLNLAV